MNRKKILMGKVESMQREKRTNSKVEIYTELCEEVIRHRKEIKNIEKTIIDKDITRKEEKYQRSQIEKIRKEIRDSERDLRLFDKIYGEEIQYEIKDAKTIYEKEKVIGLLETQKTVLEYDKEDLGKISNILKDIGKVTATSFAISGICCLAISGVSYIISKSPDMVMEIVKMGLSSAALFTGAMTLELFAVTTLDYKDKIDGLNHSLEQKNNEIESVSKDIEIMKLKEELSNNAHLEGGYANPDFSNISQEMHTAAQKEL